MTGVGTTTAQAWPQLVGTLLLGTARQPLQLPANPDPLGALLQHSESADTERQALNAAAILAVWRAAGAQPHHSRAPLMPTCPPDEMARCNARAAEHLRLMLDRLHEGALPEWLAALQQAGQRIPDEFLPEVLEQGALQPSLRLLLLPVLGERGRWLAAQNADWAYAAPMDDDALWQTGAHDARTFLLKRLRAQDPARARDLLLSTWQTERAPDRVSLLATFGAGLSMQDEPFLEAALDDRSKEVRRTAAELLTHLPDSRLVQRMTLRADPLLHYKPARLRGLLHGHIDITQAPTHTPEMQRDGIAAKPPAVVKRMGAGAWLLLQLLSAVPPSHWSQRWNVTPDTLVRATVDDEWQMIVWEGWALAAQRQRDPAWATALLNVWPSADTVQEGLLDVLPPAQREDYALRLLHADGGPLRHDQPALPVLRACTHTWGAPLSRAVLHKFQHTIQASANRFTDWELRSALASFAEYLSPHIIDEASEGWPTAASAWPQWQKTVEECLGLLTFRHAMLAALTQPGEK
jgi:hypothetical protein